MSKQKPMSPKTKKALLGVGITFGTIAVFFVSFFLAFSLIINPITIMPVSNGDAEKENKELKAQITKLEDENEHLETTVEKYRASSSSPKQSDVTSSSKSETKSETKTETKVPSQSSSGTSASNGTKSETKPEQKHEGEASASQTTQEAPDSQSGSGFSPETVTTPEGGGAEEPDESITVIDISE